MADNETPSAARLRSIAEMVIDKKVGVTLLEGSAQDILFVLDELNRERLHRIISSREKDTP